MRAISSDVERVLREAREYDRRNLSNDHDSPKCIDAFIDRDLRRRPRGRLVKFKVEDGKWRYIRVSYGSKVNRFRETHKKKNKALCERASN